MKAIGNGFKSSKRLWPFLVLFAISAGCADNEKSDAYGQFEAVETTVSAETNGKLLRFTATEGSRLRAGAIVGLVDTARPALKKKELKSRLESIRARITNINARVEVQKEQLETALTNLKRTESLLEDSAATEQQLDNARGEVRSLRKQIVALQTEKGSVRAEISATQVRIEQVEQQMEDAVIRNPVYGTVLNTFVEPHEVVQSGRPLYRVASLDTLELRVYISGARLPAVKLGQQAQVAVDRNEKENRFMEGTVSWISPEAEFTPRMIQTKEERVTQVYAVKVRVPNPAGVLKIGMPGEVNF